MKTKETRGAISASSPVSDMLKSLPSGATVIAAAGSRTPHCFKFELVYSVDGQTSHISFIKEGGRS
ncbi:MAG TPA: hypothetical protein DEQ30_04995 [Porphyromonadaceae bacterium]|nr:hypothetical protein [Porphyromonadaceae bacterium]